MKHRIRLLAALLCCAAWARAQSVRIPGTEPADASPAAPQPSVAARKPSAKKAPKAAAVRLPGEAADAASEAPADAPPAETPAPAAPPPPRKTSRPKPRKKAARAKPAPAASLSDFSPAAPSPKAEEPNIPSPAARPAAGASKPKKRRSAKKGELAARRAAGKPVPSIEPLSVIPLTPFIPTNP